MKCERGFPMRGSGAFSYRVECQLDRFWRIYQRTSWHIGQDVQCPSSWLPTLWIDQDVVQGGVLTLEQPSGDANRYGLLVCSSASVPCRHDFTVTFSIGQIIRSQLSVDAHWAGEAQRMTAPKEERENEMDPFPFHTSLQ